MIVHFDNLQKALDHLGVSNFRRVSADFYISKSGCGEVSARIIPVRGEVVCIFFAEIERAA